MDGDAHVYKLAVYDWTQVSTPAALTPANLANDTNGNDPSQPSYDPSAPSWTGVTYTYLGGSPTSIKVIDDDGVFQDGYVETGTPATLAEDVTISGVTYAAGSIVENEFALVDAGGSEVWVIRIGGVNVGFAPQVPYYAIPAGVTFSPVEARDGDAAASSDGISSDTAYSGVICFGAQTSIATPEGARRADSLVAGDLVLTADHGPQPLIWVAHSHVRLEDRNDPARPILCPKDAFGSGVPERDLILSPQHRVLLSGPALDTEGDQLAPVCGLLGLPRLRVMYGLRRVTYVHLLLERHAILSSEGVASESFYPGPMALRALDGATGRQAAGQVSRDPARPMLSRAQAEALVEQARIERRRGGSKGADWLRVAAFADITSPVRRNLRLQVG